MSRPLLIAAVAGATGLAACAPMPPSDNAQTSSRGTPCFYTDEVDNFRGNDQSIYVRTRRDVFELQTLGLCSDVDFAFAIAFVPSTGLDRLCVGDTSRLLAGVPPREPCRIRVAKRLTQAEVMALPSRDRP